MHTKARKVMIIGAGNVGASAAYALLNQSICEELILVDLNQQRAEAHAGISAMPRPICRG